jgi:predicted nucleic acid-binding protein
MRSVTAASPGASESRNTWTGSEKAVLAERVYWDSCVWIGLLNEEPDKMDSAKWVIERAERGEVEIWTSTITLAEVYKVRQGGEADSEADKKLDDFLSQPYIVHVQVDQDVALEARHLLRAKLPGLKKPYDAVHLASAIWHNIETFHTFDRDDLLPLSGHVKCVRTAIR